MTKVLPEVGSEERKASNGKEVKETNLAWEAGNCWIPEMQRHQHTR